MTEEKKRKTVYLDKDAITRLSMEHTVTGKSESKIVENSLKATLPRRKIQNEDEK